MTTDQLQLLTEDEVVRLLRLDVIETGEGERAAMNPRERLRNLRRQHRIGFVKLPCGIRYRHSDVHQFIQTCTVEPRGT